MARFKSIPSVEFFWVFRYMYPTQQIYQKEGCVSRTTILQLPQYLLFLLFYVLCMDNMSFITMSDLKELHILAGTILKLSSNSVKLKFMDVQQQGFTELTAPFPVQMLTVSTVT
nr:uncharacterized protein LOC117687771 [Crassostrea gigas]